MVDDWPDDTSSREMFSWRAVIAIRAKYLLIFLAGLGAIGAMGRYFWLAELPSHFIAWYALGTAFVGAALWATRTWGWALAATALFLLLAAQPLAWHLPANASSSENSVPCRILLANVLTSNWDHLAFLDLVESVDPDVICVQEVNGEWNKSLEPLRERYPFHFVVSRSDNFGIALFSRVSPEQPEILFQKELGVPALAVPVELDGAKAQLLNIHTVPPVRESMAQLRGEQLAAARDWYQSQEQPAIIMGDLNLTMYSPVYRDWIGEFDAKNARQGHGPLGSWPTFVPFLRLPLDHCLVSPEIEVVDCRLGPDIGSDHLPLIVDLRLPRQSESGA